MARTTISDDRLETIRLVARVGIAGLVVGPGLSKILTYGRSVQFFETLGLPAASIVVPLVGASEVAVAIALLVDRWVRSIAAVAIALMLVAVLTAGPSWQNVGVLVAALVLIGIDTKVLSDSANIDDVIQ